MRAVVREEYGIPDALQVRDVPVPSVGDGEVLIRVRAAGVDPSVWHLMTGLPLLVRAAYGLRRPKLRVWGFDVAGRVEAIGRTVTDLRIGDDVFGTSSGAFAEYASAPRERLAIKPGKASFEQAAAVGISGRTALQALRDRGELRAGERVMIIGAGGGVGTFAVQIAKALGAQVTGVCSTSKLDLVRSLGADEVIDYIKEDCTDGRRTYDVIVDTAGDRLLRHLRRALAPRGRLVLVGGEGGGRMLGGLSRILRASALSSFGGPRLRGMLTRANNADLAALARMIEAGTLRPVVGATYPLTQVADALRQLEGGHTRGKIVITI